MLWSGIPSMFENKTKFLFEWVSIPTWLCDGQKDIFYTADFEASNLNLPVVEKFCESEEPVRERPAYCKILQGVPQEY